MSAAHGVWWMVAALGAGIVVLGLVSTRRWASRSAARAVALFERVDAPTGAQPIVRRMRDVAAVAPERQPRAPPWQVVPGLRSRSKSMHVFVTGASGLTGPAVVSALIEAGHTVTGLAR